MADAKIELLLCEAAATMASDVSEANVAIETSSWNSELDDTVDVPQNAGASWSEAAAAAPIASELPIPSLPSLHIKRVRFNLEDTSIEFITPYAEIYGAHPRTFVFDKDSLMIPAARGGFVSADYVMGAEEELDDDDDDDCETSQEDGGWESWLLEQERSNSDDEDTFEVGDVFGSAAAKILETLSKLETLTPGSPRTEIVAHKAKDDDKMGGQILTVKSGPPEAEEYQEEELELVTKKAQEDSEQRVLEGYGSTTFTEMCDHLSLGDAQKNAAQLLWRTLEVDSRRQVLMA